ncbi:iron donor protein CyaY [Microvirgula aerodenitrificans]|uniref:iron donor protein CyaY n=1 Tax=Microvirgula aerodenitrificans TaxID=57480 RepID=UPI00248D64B3|nr:iron donor protein CyaY [Microvirgula aerodenitrificans]
MNDSEFLAASEAVLDRIQNAFDDAGIGDALRTGNVLTLEFDNGSQIIVNRHEPNREIWVAARSGGFHFRHDGTAWIDTRNGGELFARLGEMVAGQAGEPFSF